MNAPELRARLQSMADDGGYNAAFVLLDRTPGSDEWRETEMRAVGNDVCCGMRLLVTDVTPAPSWWSVTVK